MRNVDDERKGQRAVRELGDSLFLLGLAAGSVGAYVGVALAVVRVFTAR